MFRIEVKPVDKVATWSTGVTSIRHIHLELAYHIVYSKEIINWEFYEIEKKGIAMQSYIRQLIRLRHKYGNRF